MPLNRASAGSRTMGTPPAWRMATRPAVAAPRNPYQTPTNVPSVPPPASRSPGQHQAVRVAFHRHGDHTAGPPVGTGPSGLMTRSCTRFDRGPHALGRDGQVEVADAEVGQGVNHCVLDGRLRADGARL